MHYIVIEQYKAGRAKAVYQRFADRGRMMPDGLEFVSSWVTEDLMTCYQIMRTENYDKLEEWMAHWRDLVDFEVRPVISSQEAMERV